MRVATVEKGTMADTVLVTGKLEALAASDVVPGGMGGKVARVLVDVGDRVSKGQTLVELEHASLAADVEAKKAMLAQAEAGFKLAEANYQRGKQLLEQNAIPQATFEAQYEFEYERAKSGLEQARAGLKYSQEQYNNAFIKSPISGVVTACNVNAGEMASSQAQQPVVTVMSLDKVVVKATVTEDQINKLQEGQEVPVLVSAVSAEPLTGVVTNIALAADPQSKAYPIKVQLENPEHLLKPGMFAEVHLENRKGEVLVVPREAVINTGGRDMAWVVEDGKAVNRPVTVGVSDGKQIEIKSGLQEGEQVVISGQESLQENAAVEVVK